MNVDIQPSAFIPFHCQIVDFFFLSYHFPYELLNKWLENKNEVDNEWMKISQFGYTCYLFDTQMYLLNYYLFPSKAH